MTAEGAAAASEGGEPVGQLLVLERVQFPIDHALQDDVRVAGLQDGAQVHLPARQAVRMRGQPEPQQVEDEILEKDRER